MVCTVRSRQEEGPGREMSGGLRQTLGRHACYPTPNHLPGWHAIILSVVSCLCRYSATLDALFTLSDSSFLNPADYYDAFWVGTTSASNHHCFCTGRDITQMHARMRFVYSERGPRFSSSSHRACTCASAYASSQHRRELSVMDLRMLDAWL